MPKNRVNQKEVKRTATKSAMCGQDELVLEPKIIQICEENHVGSNQRARDLNVPFGQNVHAAMGAQQSHKRGRHDLLIGPARL